MQRRRRPPHLPAPPARLQLPEPGRRAHHQRAHGDGAPDRAVPALLRGRAVHRLQVGRGRGGGRRYARRTAGGVALHRGGVEGALQRRCGRLVRAADSCCRHAVSASRRSGKAAAPQCGAQRCRPCSRAAPPRRPSTPPLPAPAPPAQPHHLHVRRGALLLPGRQARATPLLAERGGARLPLVHVLPSSPDAVTAAAAAPMLHLLAPLFSYSFPALPLSAHTDSEARDALGIWICLLLGAAAHDAHAAVAAPDLPFPAAVRPSQRSSCALDLPGT